MSNYWGNVLFRRCLQTESFRQLLDAAMDELYAYMNQDRIESMLAHYRSVTERICLADAGSPVCSRHP